MDEGASSKAAPDSEPAAAADEAGSSKAPTGPKKFGRFKFGPSSKRSKPPLSPSETEVHEKIAGYKAEDYFADLREQSDNAQLIESLNRDIESAWLLNLNRETAPKKLRKNFLRAFGPEEQCHLFSTMAEYILNRGTVTNPITFYGPERSGKTGSIVLAAVMARSLLDFAGMRDTPVVVLYGPYINTPRKEMKDVFERFFMSQDIGTLQEKGQKKLNRLLLVPNSHAQTLKTLQGLLNEHGHTRVPFIIDEADDTIRGKGRCKTENSHGNDVTGLAVSEALVYEITRGGMPVLITATIAVSLHNGFHFLFNLIVSCFRCRHCSLTMRTTSVGTISTSRPISTKSLTKRITMSAFLTWTSTM